MDEMTAGRKPLTAFHLKLIALVTMITDHIGAVFILTPFLNSLLRGIGRMAFPIYAFLIAEGCRHTRSREKYMLRLGLFALVSEIPFDLAFVGQVSFLHMTNIFYTLFLAVASVHIWELLRTRTAGFLAGLAALLPVFLADAAGSDYGGFGVLLILLLYLAKTRKTQAGVLLLAVVFRYGCLPWAEIFVHQGFGRLAANIAALCFAMLAAGVVWLYNGQRGKPVKWIFYGAYPVHIAILSALRAALSL